MTKEEFIKGVRSYLNGSYTQHLFDKANKTEDIKTLRELVIRAKSLYGSFIDDANYWLEETED